MKLIFNKGKKPIKEALIPCLFYCEFYSDREAELEKLKKDGYSLEEIAEGLRQWGWDTWAENLIQESETKRDRYALPIKPTIAEMKANGKVDAFRVSPEELEELNTLEGISDFSVILEDDYPPKKWSAITNPGIQKCMLEGMEGPFKGLKLLSPYITELELGRKVASLAKDGLYEKTELKKITIKAYPNITVQPLLKHPNIESATLDGIKETDLVLPEGSPLRYLKIGFFWMTDPKISSLTVPEDNRLEELDIATQLPFTLHSINHLKKIKRLSLKKMSSFDCSQLAAFYNLESLKLNFINEILHSDVLATLPKLKELSLWDVKNIDGAERIHEWHIENLRLGCMSQKAVEQLLSVCAPQIVSLRHIKKPIDLFKMKDVGKIAVFFTDGCEIRNVNVLERAVSLQELSLIGMKEKPEFDLSFVTSLPHLRRATVPAFPEQAKNIIKHFLAKDHTYLEFSRTAKVDENELELEIETLEYYKDIEISKYTQGTDVQYGFRDELSETLNVHDNNEAEDLIKKTLRKIKEKRDFEFDSEGDSFGVTSRSIENIKWLIDLIKDLKK